VTPHTCKISRSKLVSSQGRVVTHGRMDGGDCITSRVLAWSVIKYSLVSFLCMCVCMEFRICKSIAEFTGVLQCLLNKGGTDAVYNVVATSQPIMLVQQYFKRALIAYLHKMICLPTILSNKLLKFIPLIVQNTAQNCLCKSAHYLQQ